MPRAQVYDQGLYSAKQFPGVAQRWGIARPVHKVRICHDNRAYIEYPFTIPGAISAIPYGPQEAMPRDFWISRATLSVGRHDDATHPNDGTPSGHDITGNFVRVKRDLTHDNILASDARLRIPDGKHFDAVNDTDDGPWEVDDFNLHLLEEGEHVYPVVTSIGSGRPGTGLVFTLILVPIP